MEKYRILLTTLTIIIMLLIIQNIFLSYEIHLLQKDIIELSDASIKNSQAIKDLSDASIKNSNAIIDLSKIK